MLLFTTIHGAIPINPISTNTRNTHPRGNTITFQDEVAMLMNQLEESRANDVRSELENTKATLTSTEEELAATKQQVTEAKDNLASTCSKHEVSCVSE